MFIKSKNILKVFLFLTILGLFSACMGGDGLDSDGSLVGINSIFEPFSNDLYFGRNNINSDEQKVYDLALKTMLDNYSALISDDGIGGRIKIDLATNGIKNIIDEKQLNKIVSFMKNDEPRLFHINDTTPISSPDKDSSEPYLKDDNGNIKEFYIRVGMEYSKYKNYHDEMKTIEIRVSRVLDDVGDISTKTNPQIIRLVYEKYLATVSPRKAIDPVGKDIRGSFLEPENDCDGYYKVFSEGYSRSLLYLFQRLGFQTVYIEGVAYTDKPILHAWNKVKINGEWYNLDSTIDDDESWLLPDSAKENFLKSDQEFSYNHPNTQESIDGKSIGYLQFGIKIPASAPAGLTASDYN